MISSPIYPRPHNKIQLLPFLAFSYPIYQVFWQRNFFLPSLDQLYSSSVPPFDSMEKWGRFYFFWH